MERAIIWHIPDDDQKPVVLEKTPRTISSLLFQAFEKNVPEMKVDQHICMLMKVTREAGAVQFVYITNDFQHASMIFSIYQCFSAFVNDHCFSAFLCFSEFINASQHLSVINASQHLTVLLIIFQSFF